MNIGGNLTRTINYQVCVMRLSKRNYKFKEHEDFHYSSVYIYVIILINLYKQSDQPCILIYSRQS